jgi:hypothetical protein
MARKVLVSLILLLLLFASSISLDNSQAILPPLIVSTYQLGCNYDELTLGNQINQIAISQLSSRGFRYLVIEDCWQVFCNQIRDKGIRLQVKSQKTKVNFQTGLKIWYPMQNQKELKLV